MRVFAWVALIVNFVAVLLCAIEMVLTGVTPFRFALACYHGFLTAVFVDGLEGGE